MLIDNIIETNRWQVPINFAVTVSNENRVYRGQALDEHLEMYGMMYRLKKEKGKDMIDAEGTKRLYNEVFRFRGVADPTIPKNENTRRLTNNYGAGFLYCADILRRNGDLEGAIELAEKAIEVLPHQWQSYGYLAQVYTELDSLGRAEEILGQASSAVDVAQGWASLAHAFWTRNRKDEAYSILKRELAANPDERTFYKQLLNYYYRDKQYDSLENVLVEWATGHPEDTEAQAALGEIRELLKIDTATSGVRVQQIDTVRMSEQDSPGPDSE
ncbi:MAG: tetratricopeptide repeat protein, partial [candidate division Zixibacteria bacterium]|nr:tetratricopeptide repeat protein [candidate division Zixibacteria bacterium]